MNTVAIGIQNFEELRINNLFYIDKTAFIKEWWESYDSVTLIARPRRFGKTLTMSMVEQFFSVEYAGRKDLFEGLAIWQEEKYRQLQGTYPVINLTFANIKEDNISDAKKRVGQILQELYLHNLYLLEGDSLGEEEKKQYQYILEALQQERETEMSMAIHNMSKYLSVYYGKKVLILLDEYDTPMQEAYVNGYWDEFVYFIRNIFNATFKTNPYLERGLMTGITRVSKESIFSDLNNLNVVTTTSSEYATCFGFTEPEVFDALEEYGLSEYKKDIKAWYDGFVFGDITDIYNPWSILNFLDKKEFHTYWANTSSNSLVGKLIREGNRRTKESFEKLLQEGRITVEIDEQIVYSYLDEDERAIWSLLLAAGYLKVVSVEAFRESILARYPLYELELTNYEVKLMFCNMVRGWFRRVDGDYNDFVKAMLCGNLKEMNAYINRVTMSTFSYFDTGNRPSGAEPERFYHGFVLGLIVDLIGKYIITSNRESGFGRYDVMLEPRNKKDDGIILEFKVHDPEEEQSLEDTVQAALKQIKEMNYAQTLIDHGVTPEKIRKYGFAFEGKKVLIGSE